MDVRTWPSFDALRAVAGADARFWYLTTKGRTSPWDAAFAAGDHLVFGRETRGLPDSILATAPAGHTLRIPMAPGGTRSLNLATAVGITLYEAVRQQKPGW